MHEFTLRKQLDLFVSLRNTQTHTHAHTHKDIEKTHIRHTHTQTKYIHTHIRITIYAYSCAHRQYQIKMICTILDILGIKMLRLNLNVDESMFISRKMIIGYCEIVFKLKVK